MSLSAANAILSQTTVVDENNKYTKQTFLPKPLPPFNTKNQNYYKWDIVWRNVFVFIYLYSAALYGLYLICSGGINWKTAVWMFYTLVIGTLGATAGAHRLWTHNTYKARLPLKILLAYFQTTCFQNHIYEWVRDHRAHHKYADTDADPHNASRGFFFSHVGWLLVRKHKDVIEKGKTIWMEDLKRDPVVMFQKKYFALLMPLFCFIIPPVVPWYFWNESLSAAWYASIFRYVFNVNGTWLVNSAAHIYGYRPYDKNILAVENAFVGYFGFGEGWHNYHHTFPWDYKASEMKNVAANLTTRFINLMAKIGWAYDLKTVPEDAVRRRMLRTGDGSVKVSEQVSLGETKEYDTHVWGWDDDSMSQEDRTITRRFYNNGD